jgi:hypothetical protein
VNANAPLTPKEFADMVFGDRRSARWVRNECRRYIKTKGRRGIKVIGTGRPYLIPRGEVARWGMSLFEQRVQHVA